MKKICFITSSRADFGILEPSISRFISSENFSTNIIVTGMHLSEKFGSTYRDIEKTYERNLTLVNLGELEDSKSSILKQVSNAITLIGDALINISPDAVILLGDRYEILGAAQAAFFNNIPIIHLHGGERTDGAIDDSIRHAITKLSTFHFTSTLRYSKRVIQLGEDPSRVFNLGAPGLENFSRLSLLSREDLENSFNVKFTKKFIVITFHPVTNNYEDINELISALTTFKDVTQIISLPNSDFGHDSIIKALSSYNASNENVILFKNIGQLKYSSLISLAHLVVGNSSSGVIECPFVGTFSINIGKRQAGRIMPQTVFSLACNSKAIQEKISTILKEDYPKSRQYDYGNGDFSNTFHDKVLELDLSIQKTFYDFSDEKLND